MALTMAPPEVDITRPVATPVAPFGLFSVVDWTTPEDAGAPRWLAGGIEFEHPSCDGAVVGISGECDEDPLLGFPLDPERGRTTASATPFSLIASEECGPVGVTDRIRGLAREKLLRHRQEAAEDVISSGSLNTTPTFAGATVLGAGAVSLKLGLGLLAQHAAQVYGIEGAVIHAPRTLAGFVNEHVTETSGHLETLTGEKVALGAGYDNSSPADPQVDAGAGQFWVYVTPPVFGLMTEPEPFGGADRASNFDRRTNSEEAHEISHLLFSWEACPLGAVLIDASS